MTKALPQASTSFLLPLYASAILEKPLLHANCPGCNICTVGLVFFLWSLFFGDWPGQLKRTKQLRNTISQKSWQKVSMVLPGSLQAERLQQMQGEPGKLASSLLSAPHKGIPGLCPGFPPTALTPWDVSRAVSESSSPSVPKDRAAWTRRQVHVKVASSCLQSPRQAGLWHPVQKRRREGRALLPVMLMRC